MRRVFALFCSVLVLGLAGCDHDTTITTVATTATSGVSATAPPLSTTETVVDSSWVDLHPTGTLPAARVGHSMVYDPAGGRLILFGGAESSGNSLNDTWAYDPAANNWTNLEPAGDVPPASVRGTMVYDVNGTRVILYGSADDSDAASGTWAYDPEANTWTDLRPTATPSVLLGTTVYDPVGDRVILLGGLGEGSYMEVAFVDDVWAYDPAANTWTEPGPQDGAPSVLNAAVYDPGTDRVILFGGRNSDGEYLDATWSYRPRPK
jgi:N-acetylneuraminic acid mutarotase